MALGDKIVNYNFYGAVYRDFAIQNDDRFETTPIGKLVQYDTYAYNDATANYGKPLDDTVALWKISSKSSFNKMSICINKGNSLDFQIGETPRPTGYSLMSMQITNIGDFYNSGFSLMPVERFAYGRTDPRGYNKSALVADLNKTKFCLQWNVAAYDKTNEGIGSRSFADIVSWINANPTQRKVIYIRPIIYAANETPRLQWNESSTGNWTWIPEIDGSISNHGTIIFDTLTDFMIPDNAEHYRPLINDNKIYAPFSKVMNSDWLDYGDTVSSSNAFLIGTTQDLKISSVISGTSGHERGRFFHCNFEVHDFEDVTYQWRFIAYYREGKRELENGFPLNTLNPDHHIRFHTELDILNPKGKTIGEATRLAILHEYAYMGFYFTKTQTLAENAILGSSSENLNDIFLPEFIGGTTTGRYFTGNAIRNVPYADSNSVNDIYHPDEPTENAKTGFPDEVIAIPRFGATYLCTFDDIDNLNANLKTMDWDSEALESLFFGQNPYDFIISATGYPLIDYPAPIPSYKSDVMLGKCNINELPNKVGNCEGYKIMGGIVIYPNPFGDLYVTPAHDTDGMAFLDYEPYTKLQLYLPYAEMVSIPPEVFMGKTIGVRMAVDFMSGNVAYYIYVKESGMLFTTTNGNMATEIPVSGRDYTSYKEAQIDSAMKIYNGACDTLTNTIGHIAGATVSESFENEAGARAQTGMAFIAGVRGIGNVACDIYKAVKTAPSPVSVSTGSASLGTACEQDARLYILRPKLPENFNAQTFKKVYGKSTAQPGKLSDCSGFTIMLNPVLDGIDCTAEEKQMIIDCLKNGVIM